MIDTCGFVLKTQYNTDKSGLEKTIDDAYKEIFDTNRLFKKNRPKCRNYLWTCTKILQKIMTFRQWRHVRFVKI